jgi:hypothetical protein
MGPLIFILAALSIIFLILLVAALLDLNEEEHLFGCHVEDERKHIRRKR